MYYARTFRHLSVENLVFYDSEMTGFNPYYDRIIELACCKFDETTAPFQRLVNPQGLKIPDKIKKLTGITDIEVVHAPSARSVLIEFIRYCGPNAVLVAHNNDSADQRFLEELAGATGVKLPPQWLFIDTFRIAQKLFPTCGQGLKELCHKLGIQWEGHRALSDAVSVRSLYKTMVKVTPEEAYRYFRRNELSLSVQ